MAQRLAVLLAVASILIIACAADEPAAAYKYEKKSHSKHDKYDKPEHKEYKPEHKEYKPEHKEYKPEGYKLDGYKPDGYKPDYHKPSYSKEYEHYGEHAYPPAPYGYGYDMHKPYEPEYAAPSYGGQEGYGEPSPYDGGYWGGLNGRQIIHLQAIYPENIINSSLVQPRRADVPVDPCTPSDLSFCTDDFSVICAKRHHESYSDSYSNGGDYASGKYGPIFKTAPSTPIALGKGNVKLEYFDDQPLDGINLVTFNKHQTGYKIGAVNGFIGNFVSSASDCHPLLGPDTTIEFFQHQVPGYLIFGKVKLPVDPAIILPLGGLGYISERKTAKTMGADKTDEYTKTTPEGNKYTMSKDMAYVYNEKDDTYCGLTIVARGAVTVDYNPTGTDNDATFTGTLEWPILWTDLVTTLPLLIDDDVDTPRQIPTIPGIPAIPTLDLATIAVAYVEAVLDRVAHVCKSNSDIPWITPGSITLDVTRVPSGP